MLSVGNVQQVDPRRCRREDAEGVFYDCRHCGARSYDAGDVMLGYCRVCDRREVEVIAEEDERVARSAA